VWLVPFCHCFDVLVHWLQCWYVQFRCVGFAASVVASWLDCVVLHRENREAIDKIVERLIVDETIRGEDFRKMLSKYTQIPESNMATPTTVESNIPANI